MGAIARLQHGPPEGMQPYISQGIATESAGRLDDRLSSAKRKMPAPLVGVVVLDNRCRAPVSVG